MTERVDMGVMGDAPAGEYLPPDCYSKNAKLPSYKKSDDTLNAAPSDQILSSAFNNTDNENAQHVNQAVYPSPPSARLPPRVVSKENLD